jgi:DNA-binding XRE family transcriptional regulator
MSNQTPDATQIRAAMAMLSWENDDLAKAADIAASSVHNIKRGLTRPQPRILTAIRAVFEAQGLEFIDNSGTRRRPEGVEILQGRDGLIALLEDILESCRKGTRDIVLSGVAEDDFQEILGDWDDGYLKGMSEIPGLLMRTLIKEGDTNFVSGSYSEYRWVPRDQFEAVPFYAYGDKLAIVVFNSDPSPKIFTIKSQTVTAAYKRQFETQWNLAKPIPKLLK